MECSVGESNATWQKEILQSFIFEAVFVIRLSKKKNCEYEPQDF